MNKNGFTLIELLAVIVILAIIALIATPIVLNIINESKESAQLRSAEMYLKGVETSVATTTINKKKVADNTYQIMSDGNICLVDLVDNICSEEKTLKVEMNGEIPTSGTVTIEKGKIKDISLKYSNKKTIVKDSEGKLAFGEATPNKKTLATLCILVSGTEKTAGAKYSCEVKPGTSHNFYVLTTPAEGVETINLIMDQNINSDGTEARMTGVTQSINASQYNLVAWNEESGQSSNAYGPVTAMQFLYNATKDWTNMDSVNYTYNDKETQGTTVENTSYISFVSINGVATITPASGDGVTIGSETEPLRTRMPIYSLDITKTEITSKSNASYLYDNLDSSGSAMPYGYWTLSSNAVNSYGAWFVSYNGSLSNYNVNGISKNGVRPVITLKL